MADIYTALSVVIRGMEEALKANGFTAVYPDGVKRNELPAVTEGSRVTVDFSGEKGALRIEHFDNNIVPLFADKGEGELSDPDFGQLSLSLLDTETADEKDYKYIADDFSESLNNRCGSKAKAGGMKKLPAPVSKVSAKSGAVSYDTNTLGNRFTTLFPELRDKYKENIRALWRVFSRGFFYKLRQRGGA